MDDYLSKPVTLETLQMKLEKWTGVLAESPDGAEPHSEATGSSLLWKSASPLLDPETLAQMKEEVAGDDSFLDEVFANFLENATTTINLLRQAARGGDGRAMVNSAHSLKGSSRTLGAFALADVCERLENLGQADSVADAGELIDELEHEFGRLKDTLKT
jgi:HPt (histidine-containing phosphotransfer) domain-containing protein